MRKVIFLGKFFPLNLVRNVIEDSNGKIEMANHNFELSIINGLLKAADLQLQCITIPGVYSYPYNNRKIYTSAESYLYKGANVKSISFLNFPFIKEIWSMIGLTITLIRKIKNTKGNQVDVLINTPDVRLMIPVFIARLLLSQRITQTVIVPDIPSVLVGMNSNINIFKRIILTCLNSTAMRLASRSNGLVLLTESMRNFFNKPIKYIVVEGLVDIETMDVSNQDFNCEKEIILYTGTIRKIYGIMNLVSAFRMLENKNVELWICGSGDAQAEIEYAAKKDIRIKFFGMVDSSEALKMQKQSTILVNPRTSDGEYTKYSFPSKVIEYLLSGKSVVINRLPGIPDEYYDYVYVPENESPNAMADCLLNVMCVDRDERKERGGKGREFIMSKKNSKVQMDRVLEMIAEY